ncbi:MAG: helix-turn-helix transcriptional regulator [Gemmatimonadetes bacterium]|jgi:DNA-binding Xre family transcriptional regulator|nr:helix-turn-helix transcriptional regulator [Gemmatimonadota bacterium]MBT6144689.1 helix-turn-helix transcriptional regulator [Gemmatimonadota bacterium]MBT7861053.1 helix-turn-helix transcriptional regulator [Gemmatimonadota bacterium]
MTEKERLGKMVRCARAVHGRRQKELGEQVGLSRSQVSALEGGTDQAPVWTVDLVHRLCEALEIYPEAFTHRSVHMARVLRGRVSSHLSHLGLWERLSEAYYYVLIDVHRLRPDVSGLSVMIGSHPSGEPRAYTARLGPQAFHEVGVRPGEARYGRWQEITEEVRLSPPPGRLGPVKVLSQEEAPIIPDTYVLEWLIAGGTMQLAISGSVEEPDEHLSELMIHLGDEVDKQMERIRNQPTGGGAALQELRDLAERVRRLENGAAS